MKISKLILPIVALTATYNYPNNQVQASCMRMCDEVLHGCIDACCANSFFPMGCYGGCVIGFGICTGICTSLGQG